MAGATRTDKIYSIIDYSYRSKNCAGDGFILIGDAYGFLDPIYSSGVLLALKMAELAADSIHDAFNNNDFSGARLGQFQSKLDKGIESMRKLVYAFYNEGFSFAQFLQKNPDQRVNIINLLMGDVFKEGVDDIYEPNGRIRGHSATALRAARWRVSRPYASRDGRGAVGEVPVLRRSRGAARVVIFFFFFFFFRLIQLAL